MLSKALSIKRGCYACQSLDNIDMCIYTKLYQIIPCSSKVVSFLLTVDGRTHTWIIVQTCVLCNNNIYPFTSSLSIYEPRHAKTVFFFAYAKTKTQISFPVTAKLISVFVCVTHIVRYLYFLNPKFQGSNHLV